MSRFESSSTNAGVRVLRRPIYLYMVLGHKVKCVLASFHSRFRRGGDLDHTDVARIPTTFEEGYM